MKQLVLIMAIMAQSVFLTGQITLESTYNHSGTFTNLTQSGYKFYIMDVGANQCRIYNTNHTLWKTINLSVPADNYLYDIRYISENLFTTDNTLCLAYIYYSYNATGQYYTYTAKVISENGTELRSIPGCQYLYAHSVGTAGTKLVAYSYNYSVSPYTIQTLVYNLPGQLVSGSNGVVLNEETLQAFPNPANDFITIYYEFPDGLSNAEMIIHDIEGNVVRKFDIANQSDNMMISTASFPKGFYLFSINSGNRLIKSGKFIVQ
ncbi:MAG: T9SS type A sorting domain-containing protein [Bacteroidales bacterium]|nr:T9SS type A sorting domain-containing protein [Bacteroidales bacterium]